MTKKVKIAIFLVLTVGVIAALSVISSKKISTIKCSDVLVKMSKHSPHFTSEEEIAAFIKMENANLLDTPIYSINTDIIEKQLSKISSIKKAEVYRRLTVNDFNLSGLLEIDVEQREPLFRVSGQKDFYVDNEGIAIYETQKHPVNVMLVTGNVNEEFAKESLLPLMIFIEKDEFWRNQILQVNVMDNKELEMVPLVGEHMIEFGDSGNYRVKFRNLKALYEQGFKDVGWGRYRKISLKYENQIVCTK